MACYKKAKHAKYSGKRTFLTPTCTRVCAYQVLSFSENLVCFVFLHHPFWDLLFCLIGKLLWFNLSIASLCKTQVHWFISSILIYSYSYLIFMNLETWVVHRIFKRNLNFFFKSQPSLNQHEKYQADWTNLSWDIAVLRFCNLICHEHLWPNSIKKLLFPFLNMPYKTFTNHLLFFLIYT